MSGKTAERFQDPLEEQGWQQMKVLLDQEMPEKKRRLIWWPWLGATAAATIILFLGYQLFSDQPGANVNENQKLTLVEGKNEPVAEESQDQQDEEITMAANSEMKNATISTEKENAGSNTTQKNDDSMLKDAKSQVDNNVKFEKSEAIPSRNSEEGELPNSIVESDPKSGANARSPRANTPSQPDIADENSLLETKIVDEQINADRPKISQTVINVPQFIIEHIYVINHHILDLGENVSPTISTDKRPNWDVSLATAITSDLNVDNPGFDLGAQLRFKPLKTLAIGTGAYFWSIRSDQTFTSYSYTDPNTPISTRDDQDGALVAIPERQNLDSMDQMQPGSVSYIQTIKNLRYLRIPIFIQFFPEHAWQPYVGINHMVLLSDGRNGLLESSANADLATNGNKIEPFTDLVRRSNTGIVLGVGYRSGRHFGFDLSYTFAGKSYLNYEISEGKYTEHHRFLRVGLDYQF